MFGFMRLYQSRSLLSLVFSGMIFLTPACSMDETRHDSDYVKANWLPAPAGTLAYNGFVGEGGGTDDDQNMYYYYVNEKNKDRKAKDPLFLPDLDDNLCVGRRDCINIPAPTPTPKK